MSTRTSPTRRIPLKLRLMMKMKNLANHHPSGNGSVYVGTNYKDENTHDAEKQKQP
jgi:hypothetical protein